MKILSKKVSDTKAMVLSCFTDDTIVTNTDITVIPNPIAQIGKTSQLYINPTTSELYYEYTDIPKTKEEEDLRKKLIQAEELNSKMLKSLVEGGLM